MKRILTSLQTIFWISIISFFLINSAEAAKKVVGDLYVTDDIGVADDVTIGGNASIGEDLTIFGFAYYAEGHAAFTEEHQLIDKEYVDDISIGTYFDFYAYDDNSDVGTYKEFKLEPSTGAEVEGNVSILGNATGQIVGARITEDVIDIPSLMYFISSGVFTFHVHLRASTAKRLKFYAELYTYALDTTETLICTTIPTTEYISVAGGGYNSHGDVNPSVTLAAGDRLVVKGYATNASPVATTLYIAVEGDTATRVNLPGVSTPAHHESLVNLNWADAGHTIDTDVDFNGYDIEVGSLTASGSLSVSDCLTVGTTKLVVNNIGRVGIGTDAPKNLLHINSGAGPSLSQLRFTANNLGSLSFINYERDSSYIGFDADWDTLWTARDTTAFGLEKSSDKFSILGKSGLTPDSTFYFVESDRQLTVLANGNIGIGTMTPEALLDVAGDLSVSESVTANAYFGDGSNLSGVTASPAGNDTEIQFNDGGVTGASASCWYNKGSSYFYAPVVSTAAVLSQGQVYAGDTSHSGSIRLYDGDGEYFTMSINNFVASWSLKWPLDDGDVGEVLGTNGSGVTDWTVSGSSEWTDLGTSIVPTEISDDVTLGGSLTVNGYIYNDAKHYAFLTLSGNDATAETNDEIDFILSEGNMTHNDGTHQTTLSKGVTYRLMGAFRCNGDNATSEVRFQWYDVTNSSVRGSQGYATSPDTNTDNTINPSAVWVETPETDIQVELRITSSIDISTVFEGNAWGMIEEISR